MCYFFGIGIELTMNWRRGKEHGNETLDSGFFGLVMRERDWELRVLTVDWW